MCDINSDYLEVDRKYRTPKDLEEISAKDLLDELKLEKAAEVLDEFFGKVYYERGEWTDWKKSSITKYGQLRVPQKIIDGLQVGQEDTVIVQVRFAGETVEKEYEFGKDTNRVAIGIGGREQLDVDKGTNVKWRLKKPEP